MAKFGIKASDLQFTNLGNPHKNPLVRTVWRVTHKPSGLDVVMAFGRDIYGVGLGGSRVYDYKTLSEQARQASLLAEGMEQKSAIALCPYDGFKAVLMPFEEGKRAMALEAYAVALVALMEKGFHALTGEDVGFKVEYVEHMIATVPESRKCLVGMKNPAPFTARGVFNGMKAALKHLGIDSWKGQVVGIQGVGAVGLRLTKLILDNTDAEVWVDDVNPAAIKKAVKLGAKYQPGVLTAKGVTIASPNALGQVITPAVVKVMRQNNVLIIAGAANNQLSDIGVATMVGNILLVPDFVINAGGLISVMRDVLKSPWSTAKVNAQVRKIYKTCLQIFKAAEKAGISTQKAAVIIAANRVNKAMAG